MGDIKELINAHCEREAKKQGNNHACPVIRSMYPLTSRGGMAKKFEHLYFLGHSSLAPLLERAMKQLKDECYCDVDYNGYKIICDPCKTLEAIKTELEGEL